MSYVPVIHSPILQKHTVCKQSVDSFIAWIVCWSLKQLQTVDVLTLHILFTLPSSITSDLYLLTPNLEMYISPDGRLLCCCSQCLWRRYAAVATVVRGLLEPATLCCCDGPLKPCYWADCYRTEWMRNWCSNTDWGSKCHLPVVVPGQFM